jgi:hypothetical protein
VEAPSDQRTGRGIFDRGRRERQDHETKVRGLHDKIGYLMVDRDFFGRRAKGRRRELDHRRLADTPGPGHTDRDRRPRAWTIISATISATPEKFRKSRSVSLSGHMERGQTARQTMPANPAAVATGLSAITANILSIGEPLLNVTGCDRTTVRCRQRCARAACRTVRNA